MFLGKVPLLKYHVIGVAQSRVIGSTVQNVHILSTFWPICLILTPTGMEEASQKNISNQCCIKQLINL